MSWNPNYIRKSKTTTSSEVKDRYNAKAYDQIIFRCGKGGREAIKAIAATRGMSLAEYLRHLIIEDCKNHGNDGISPILGGGGELGRFLSSIIKL